MEYKVDKTMLVLQFPFLTKSETLFMNIKLELRNGKCVKSQQPDQNA